MDMLSHAWGVLKGGPLDVRVRFGEPVAVSSVGDRKKLATHAYERVRVDFSQLLTGRSRKAHGAAESADAARRPASSRLERFDETRPHQDLWLPDERL
jgi:1-acyl-sn-glycerol-3-phosphate acyltransferase